LARRSTLFTATDDDVSEEDVGSSDELTVRLEQRFAVVKRLLDAALVRLRDQGVEPPERWLRDCDYALRIIERARRPDAVEHATDLLDRPGCETLTHEELFDQVFEWEIEGLDEIASKLMRLAVCGEGASPEEDLVAGVTLSLTADAMIEGSDEVTSRHEAHTAWWAATLHDDARFNQLRRQMQLRWGQPRRRSSPRLHRTPVSVSRRSARRSRRRTVRAGPAAQPSARSAPDPPPPVAGWRL
jgi:hypothetical protein